MSILLMAHVMELDISSTAKFVLLVMANFASDEGENVYPSHDTIARLTSLKRRAVVTNVQQLSEAGYVVLEGKRGNRQNIYSLNVDKILQEGARKSPPKEPQVCLKDTPEDARCAPNAQNPLSIKRLTDKRLKDLKDSTSAPNAHLDMMKILSNICKQVLNDNAPMLGRYARSLIKLGYTLEDVMNFETWWYKNDWRGKRKQPPTPAQVQQLIGTSKLKTTSSIPTQAEIDKAMSELTWEDEDYDDTDSL